MSADTIDKIRLVLTEHARLPGDVSAVGVDDDLYQAGMSSHASVNVMLALEEAFDVEFPDELLTRSVFETIASIERAVERLKEPA
jgi:acyl carrier protein